MGISAEYPTNIHAINRSCMHIMGVKESGFSQRIRKLRLEVKWNSNFPQNAFGNYRLPPVIVLFFRLKRNEGNALIICQLFSYQLFHQPKTIMGNRIIDGKLAQVTLVCEEVHRSLFWTPTKKTNTRNVAFEIVLKSNWLLAILPGSPQTIERRIKTETDKNGNNSCQMVKRLYSSKRSPNNTA